ncbi:hypothetical protein IPA_07020 [Ignicoccus pacificus DSM 13166]|uniref:ORC1-type DNA replication protein n=1 Tax=Ignicoccus pacificus DSM 13166 TaxID=940294 RepID=A0A977PKA1_9CREN|nr:hypothetical protein IPA_07020 [Ignicoccus pacificus DSM 13166]
MLDQSYVPEKMITREHKVEQLARYFLDFLDNPGSTYHPVLITGKQGVGKTHMTFRFFRDLKEAFVREHRKDLVMAYVNCHFRNRSLMQILRTVATSLRANVPTRGISADEVFNSIARILEKKDMYMLLVLDDFQYALHYDPQIASFIARIYEQTDELKKKRIQSIIIMDDASKLDMYTKDERVRSWKDRHIYMNPYKKEELRLILEDRREKAFYPDAVPDEVIDRISELLGIDTHPGYPISGSARSAIETLRLAGERAENRGDMFVTLEDVNYAWGELTKHGDIALISEALEGLTDHELLFLYSLASVLMAGNDPARIGLVEEEYRSLCELLGVEPRKHTQIYEYAKRLAEIGIIWRTTNNKGMRGRSSLLTIEYPLEPFRNRVAEILRRRGYEI